jgi:hypothetical protein
MTDLIDRVHGESVGGFREADLDSSWLSPQQTQAAPRRFGPVHVFTTILLGSNAVLLMANVGHLSGWRLGAAIAVAWVDVVMAIAVIVHPTPVALGLTMAGSLATAGIWLSTNGTPAISNSVWWVGVVLAVASFVTALLLRVVPSFARSWSPSTLVLTSVIPVGVVIVTTAALLANPTAPVAPTAKAPQSFASTSAALAEKLTVPVPGQNSKAFQQVLAGNTSEQTELKPYVPLGPADQATMTKQLTQALFAAEEFPTVASAKAAGMILAGGMAPGVGAHYQVIGASDLTALDGQFNPSQPASWIYASTADSAPVVGVMYESLTAQPPAGFIGPNDHWHRHSNVCVKFTAGQIAVPFAADQNVTPQECSDVHGSFMKKTVWMVHAWVVPGWESPQGVFSHDNLHVYCPGNTDLVDAIGFCARQQ